MLKLQKAPLEVKWPITVVIPDQDGKRTEVEAELTYRVPLDVRPREGQSLREIIVNWSGVGDDEGNALPFNADNLEAFLANPFARIAAERGLGQIYAGEYLRKN